jgi:hypothetical protein
MTMAWFGLLVGVAVQAQADQTFDFSFSGSGITGNAILTATPNGDGSFTAISSTGTITGAPDGITDLNSLLPNPNAPGVYVPADTALYYDNQLFPGQNPPIDINGLSWISNGVSFVIYGIDVNSGFFLDDNNSLPLSISLSSVPEPSTLVLGSVGGLMMGLGVALRRRRAVAAV